MSNTFSEDVQLGLTAKNKFLYSKYFYDDIGSRIFQEIMEMPEYYLTDSEFAIFKEYAAEIHAKLDFNVAFDLIELGAGDGLKTAELIRHLIENEIPFTYKPIDISQEANDLLSAQLKAEFPQLVIEPQTGDYFEILKNLKKGNAPSLLLFIGSNIGNYTEAGAKDLFQLLQESMKLGDKLLIGVDLKKDAKIIHAAYSDPHGITRRFNLNLLERINRELNADFDIDQFDFRATYEGSSGEVRSYLVSLEEQNVTIQALDIIVKFKKGESIWTELSKKYDLTELENLVCPIGFGIIDHFLDQKKYFSDSLFEKR